MINDQSLLVYAQMSVRENRSMVVFRAFQGISDSMLRIIFRPTSLIPLSRPNNTRVDGILFAKRYPPRLKYYLDQR